MPDGHKLDQMAIKYANIVHRNTLQNLPKLVFLVWKQAIWQPSLKFKSTTYSCRRENYFKLAYSEITFFLLPTIPKLRCDNAFPQKWQKLVHDM
jgi:hypothetical protein